MPMKADRPKVPKFDSEAEEAKWWDDHSDIAEGELLKAMRDGTIRRGAAQELAVTLQDLDRMSTQHILLARRARFRLE